MKVCIINPLITGEQRYGRIFKDAGGRQAPLGILYIAAVLEQNGHKVSIIDAEAEGINLEEIKKRLDDFKPDIIGLTASTVAFNKAVETASFVKEKFPSVITVVGGAHPTVTPLEALKEECFDIGVVGEAEITFLEVVKAIEKKEPFDNVEGLAFRKNGQVVLTKPRKLIENLDVLPFPARHLLKNLDIYTPPPMNYKKKSVINMITSRGCSFQCIFCDQAIFGRVYRYHSAKYVVDEIEHIIKKYGAKEISIVDDNFTINKQRVVDICDEILKRKIKINWNARLHVNTVTREMLEKMRKAGCWYLEFGIESGNQEILNFIKKYAKLEHIREVAEWAYELGFRTKGFFMIGLPKETKDTLNQTIEFAKSIPITDVVVTINTPLPHTEQYEAIDQYGILTKADWSDFSMWKPVFVPYGLTEEDLMNAQKRLVREFYLRPITIWRHIKHVNQVLNPLALMRYFKGALAVMRTFW